MSNKFNPNELMEWHYSGPKDIIISFGDNSKKVKRIRRILILVVLFIIAIGVVGFIYRDYIYDYITNPHIELVNEVKHEDGNYIDVEIFHSDFDPKLYIHNINDLDKFEYEIENNVNTSKIGNYEIVYNSHNKVYDNSVSLIVRVKDNVSPTITLVDSYYDEVADKEQQIYFDPNTNIYNLPIILGVDTNNFDPAHYIKDYSDNYCDKNKLKINYTKDFSFNVKYFSIVYTVEDEYGNIGSCSLSVSVYDNIEAMEEDRRNEELQLQKVIDELEAKLNATPSPTPSPTPTPSPSPTPVQTATPTPSATPIPTEVEVTATPKPTEIPDVTAGPSPTEEIKPTDTDTPTNTPKPTATPSPTPTPEVEPDKAYLLANDVTISMEELSGNGMEIILDRCSKEMFYYGPVEKTGSYAMPSGLPGMDVQIKPGVYEVIWTTPTGLTCTQIVTITE